MPRQYGRVGSLLDALLGVPDAGLALGSGMVAGPASGFYAAQRKLRGQPVSREDVQGFADFLTYSPRTKTGQKALGAVGTGIEKVSDALPEWSRDLRGKAGEKGYELGGAVGGAIGEMLPTIAEETLGRGFGALKQASRAPTNRIWGDEKMLRQAGRGDQVDQALEMQRKQVPPDEISRKTGIYIGPASGGAPAGIISTLDAEFDSFMLGEQPIPFMDIIDKGTKRNPAPASGFDFMPNKEKLNIALSRNKAYGGEFTPTLDKGNMRIGHKEFSSGGTAVGDVLDHEASHFVQSQTNMPRGGNPAHFTDEARRVREGEYGDTVRGDARIAAQQMMLNDALATDAEIGRALYDSQLGERTARVGEAGRRLSHAEARMTDPFNMLELDHLRLSDKSKKLLKGTPREHNYVDPWWLRKWAEED